MPPHLRYVEQYCARDHYLGVTSIAFSPNGTYLATAGLDGTVCIWEVANHHLLHVYKNKTAIVSLAWILNGEDSVLLGYEDGNVATLSITSNMLSLAGFRVHDFATEIIANDGALVATAAQGEVRIWEWHPLAPWKLVIALSGPPKTSENLSNEVLVVSLHWTSREEHPSVLVVCYQNHGIFMYEAKFWTVVHTVHVRDPIARTALSPDGELLALYSLAKGIEVRRVSNGALRCAFPRILTEKRLIPIAFIHGGEVLIAGTTDGNVSIWHLETSQKIQDLAHQKNDKVLALDAYYDYQSDRFLVVTGTYGCRSRASVRWWVAVEKTHEHESSEDASVPARTSGWMSETSTFQLAVTILGVAVFTLLLVIIFQPQSIAQLSQSLRHF
ncbi:WD40-repeat-containing domain protein [Cerioporus squamosus]|nr:WD40-repeat-containing domain protein [Cerioporus squamosus]